MAAPPVRSSPPLGTETKESGLQNSLSFEAAAAIKRVEQIRVPEVQGLRRQLTVDPLVRNLSIHFLFVQSHPIWEFYSGTSKLDILRRKLGSLNDVWWMKIPLENQQNPRFTLGFDTLRNLFMQRKKERQKLISEDYRRQEFLRNRDELQRQAIIHIILRTISALSSHLLASFLRNDGIRGIFKRLVRALLFRRSPSDSRSDDPRETIEDSRILQEVHEMEQKIDQTLQALKLYLKESTNDSRTQPGSSGAFRYPRLLLAIILRIEAVKLRLVLRMRILDSVLTSEVKRRNDCILSLILNALNATFAYMDAMKLTKVIELHRDTSLPRLYKYVPYRLYGWIRVNYLRHIPFLIHLAACSINIYTAAKAQNLIWKIPPKTEYIFELEKRVSKALDFVKSNYGAIKSLLSPQKHKAEAKT